MTSDRPGLSFTALFSKNPYDIVKTPQSNDITKSEETGMDRLRSMFQLDQYGYLSRELAMISEFAILSTFGGVIIGGVARSREAFINFIENNQATKFANHLDAKRKLQREIYLSFMRGGYSLGWRVGLFSSSYVSLVTMASVYHGKDTLWHYFQAGAVTGALFKMHMGPKGMVAGSVLGSILGTVGGSISLILLGVSGFSITDIMNMSKIIVDAREKALQETRSEQLQKEIESIIETGTAKE